eukprot:580422-Alexandrium_andersonii.AAC.1
MDDHALYAVAQLWESSGIHEANPGPLLAASEDGWACGGGGPAPSGRPKGHRSGGGFWPGRCLATVRVP